jgi:phospholipid-binding lipoprotein MlaA
MRRAGGWSKWAGAWVLPLLLSACAGAPRDASLPIRDPNERMNRQVMAANQQVLRPISAAVKAVVPGPVHDRLHDLNSNLKEPRIFVNDVLQLRFDAAGRTATRFVLNSTFGMGGLLDVAGREGIPQESGDFGSTVDMVANPVGWLIGTQVAVATTQLAVTVGTTSLDAVDRLGQLKQAEDASIDFYSFIRSAYYQTRRAELREAIGLPSVVESPATSDLDDPGEAGQSVAAAH